MTEGNASSVAGFAGFCYTLVKKRGKDKTHYLQSGDGWVLLPIDRSNGRQVERDEKAKRNDLD